MFKYSFSGFLCLLLLCLVVSARAQYKNCGVVLHKKRIWNDSIHQFELMKWDRDVRIWYKDSMVIEEGQKVYSETSMHGVEKWRADVEFYTFIDLRTKSFYTYKDFTPDAPIVSKFTQPDTVSVPGGWNFYFYNPKLHIEETTNMPDTTIDHIGYKRVRSIQKWADFDNVTFTGYLLCNRKKSLFHIDRAFDEQHACLLARMDMYIPETNTYLLASEIDFITDKLTSKEVAVFKAWERNAKLNPVK